MNQPSARRRTVRTALLVLAALSLAALLAATALRFEGGRRLEHSANRFEERVGPLAFDAYQPPPVPAGENAGAALLLASRGLDANRTQWADASLLGSGLDLSDEERARLRSLLERYAGVLDSLHAAADLRKSSLDLDYAAGPAMHLPDFHKLLHAARMLAVEARLAALDGDDGRAALAIESLAALARALATEPPLIFQILGQIFERQQYESIQAILELGPAPPALLARLHQSILEVPRDRRFTEAIGGEGALVYSTRPAAVLADGGGWQTEPWERALYRVIGDGGVARALDHYAEVVAAYPGAPWAGLQEGPVCAAPPSSLLELPGSLTMELCHVAGRSKGTEALAELARLALEVTQAAVEAGEYPASLASFPAAATNPLSGAAAEIELLPAGGALLTYPGAEELWDELEGNEARRQRETFTWRLPPVATAGGESTPPR